jgi:hypothetical protein
VPLCGLLVLPAGRVVAAGAGFSAARAGRRVLLVFEPYDLDEATGTLTMRTRPGPVRIALRGRGIDTIAPAVTAPCESRSPRSTARATGG